VPGHMGRANKRYESATGFSAEITADDEGLILSYGFRMGANRESLDSGLDPVSA
jgi:hypothetical protein